MHTYTVDHTGSCKSNKDGLTYSYAAGISVGLPDDVAEALGNSATLVARGKDHEEEDVKADETADKEEPAKEAKSAKKAPKDKMVKNDDTVTK